MAPLPRGLQPRPQTLLKEAGSTPENPKYYKPLETDLRSGFCSSHRCSGANGSIMLQMFTSLLPKQYQHHRIIKRMKVDHYLRLIDKDHQLYAVARACFEAIKKAITAAKGRANKCLHNLKDRLACTLLEL